MKLVPGYVFQIYVDMCAVLCFVDRVTGGELFDEIVAREFYSEHDARCVVSHTLLCCFIQNQSTCLCVYACLVGVVCEDSQLYWRFIALLYCGEQ